MLSNLHHHSHAARLSDEIDLVLIGSRGVIVLEIKHWDLGYIKSNAITADAEAERINDKAKRIAGKLRKGGRESGFVTAKMLLTAGGTGVSGGQRQLIRGVPVFGLSEWKELIETPGVAVFTRQQSEEAARLIEPHSKPALTGQLRQFGGLISLEKISPTTESFHRVYRGQHPSRRDKVVLHLFDLSASSEKQPKDLARREFDVIQQWQKSPFVPSLLDSFQEAEQYPGELCYFSLVDSDAPTLIKRSEDEEWSRDERIRYTQDALRAVHGFHYPEDSQLPALVHRNITPETLRVRHNGKPLFTGFSFSRIADAQTISPTDAQHSVDQWAAPEVRRGGLPSADARSDVYSLCKSLSILFAGDTNADCEARTLLSMGCEENAQKRVSPLELASALECHTSPGPKANSPQLPAAEFWDEGTVVPFQSTRYKIVSRLGKGGIGQTFKVVELAANSDERFGTYVAKVIQHEADAIVALHAYRKVRAYTIHRNLSALHEIAPAWEGNRFVALLKWVEGVPLHDLTGVLEIYREELAEPSVEALALRWVKDLCAALWQLHQVRLVHGDVSPRNIIVEGGNVVLTDYDTVADQASVPRTHHAWYASDSVEARAAITTSDDLFALAACFFHVIFDREPFLFGAIRRKNQGLNWENIEAAEIPQLRKFLDRATHPNPQQRFLDARDALSFLTAEVKTGGPSSVTPSPPLTTLSAQVVDRLNDLLSAYPGSRYGNAETRGLDSDFAAQTYVETGLDQALKQDVQAANVDLIVLFGNAGDGKTAFLQNLAKEVSGDLIPSQQRLCERRLEAGRMFKVNLDGSAAYQNQSANQILEAFFKPFHTLAPTHNSTHAIAINSGKMLEWLDERDDDTPFTEQLRDSLFGSERNFKGSPNPRLRLIDLNHRSLVGGINEGKISTQFLDALLDRFLGTQLKQDPWSVCASCSAQHRCSARASILELRDAQHGARLRRRLADALQACHLRGEIHITARELRAALVFIFFGVHDCQELHDNPELTPAPYWDRVFAAEGPASAQRQGELLKELARFDPALDANPIVDRQLLAQHAAAVPGTADRLASARRRAYFEWSEADFAQLQLSSDALPLHGAQHLDRFRLVPLMSEQEQQTLCHALCQGIARLENLPDLAHTRSEGLPLRLTPRTPTDSAFWVFKPWARFTLTAPLPPATQGLEVLHTHLVLTYRYANGSEEHLPIGLELFHLLLELKDGMQLSGIGQEGVFAHLEIFVQRLAQEDSRELWGWHPEADSEVMRLRISLQDGRQTLIRELAPQLIRERA
ncbi:Serine/threonine protein kinase [Paraburkholderia phenazinium]|uniref:Serine/threonine protein kinase n=2 Tax=Paraburkholderia phenazinium TaxID=60549 RepID=A0A1G7P681_9BURK|nr:Serine/threonine protein kinase [Paraburkholderia phenazinium]